MKVPRQSFITRHRARLTLAAALTLFVLSVLGTDRHLPLLFWTGMGLVGMGQALRLWAAGCLCKDEQVVTDGPFGCVRHPLYLGSFIVAVGYCLMSGLLLSLLIVPPLFLAVYYPSVVEEERFLSEKFGDAYRAYCAGVPRFLPRWRIPSATFQWQLVMENKEYEALVGNVILVGLFVLFRG